MADKPQPDPHKLKVVELKEELSQRGLDISGLKKDLVDRLVAAQNLDISGGSETAPLNDEIKAMGQPLGHRARAAAAAAEAEAEEQAESGKQAEAEIEVVEQGAEQIANVPDVDSKRDASDSSKTVGHSMVEGAEERASELDAQAEAAVSDSDIELEPAVLDSEVARSVAKEEAKATLPPTPPRIRSISPLPPTRPATPPRLPERAQQQGEDRAEGSSSGGGQGVSRKRSVSPSGIPTSPRHKRQRRTDYLPLPSALSHLVHPPTCTLYITNLRRPLVHSALHEHVFPSSTPPGPSARFTPARQPFAGEAFPALWLSGVKDHAYATYLSEQDALEAAERIDSSVWPEEGSGAELKVQFVDDELVRGLLEQEEDAWNNGRQKLSLKVTIDDDEETGFNFELIGGTATGRRNTLPPPRPPPGAISAPPARRPPVAVPLTGVNAIRPPSAPTQSNRGPGPVLNGAASGTDRRDPPPHAPSGPSAPARNGEREPARANFIIRGRGGGYGGAVPPHLAHNGNSHPGMQRDRDRDRDDRFRGAAVPPGATLVGIGSAKDDGRLVRPIKRTLARPFITYREGPGAVARA